jgi:hypothetical protein
MPLHRMAVILFDCITCVQKLSYSVHSPTWATESLGVPVSLASLQSHTLSEAGSGGDSSAAGSVAGGAACSALPEGSASSGGASPGVPPPCEPIRCAVSPDGTAPSVPPGALSLAGSGGLPPWVYAHPLNWAFARVAAFCRARLRQAGFRWDRGRGRGHRRHGPLAFGASCRKAHPRERYCR